MKETQPGVEQQSKTEDSSPGGGGAWVNNMSVDGDKHSSGGNSKK